MSNVIVEKIINEKSDVFRKNLAISYIGMGVGLSLGYAVGYAMNIVTDVISGDKTYCITDIDGNQITDFSGAEDAYYIIKNEIDGVVTSTDIKIKIIPSESHPLPNWLVPIKIAIYASCIGVGGIIGINKINKFSQLLE
jgi:hypothetical protein